jgi:hypothetical protein
MNFGESATVSGGSSGASFALTRGRPRTAAAVSAWSRSETRPSRASRPSRLPPGFLLEAAGAGEVGVLQAAALDQRGHDALVGGDFVPTALGRGVDDGVHGVLRRECVFQGRP